MRQFKKSFTLIEVLIATLILIVILGASASALVNCHYLIDTTEKESIAIFHLRNIMEKIKATSFNTIETVFPDGVVDGNDTYQGFVGNYVLPNEHITITYGTATANLLEISAIISWDDLRGRVRNASLFTFRTR